jgi:transposase
VCRKTAVQARRIALQIIQTIIVCAPDRLRNLLRNMTRMKFIRTLAAWRPDLTWYRDVEEAYKIALKSLARRYLELHDEVADLDDMIEAIVTDLAPELMRVSDFLCMSNLVHASLTKEHEDNDDYEGSIRRAAERG